MRKKSHLALAYYLMTSEGMETLTTHKKAFYWGSILPDCVPSFITTRHCIDDTFLHVRKELMRLVCSYNPTKGITSSFCRRLGVILHYVADYFTFPHNSFYPGTITDHCRYEEELKQTLHFALQLQAGISKVGTLNISPTFSQKFDVSFHFWLFIVFFRLSVYTIINGRVCFCEHNYECIRGIFH